MRASVSEDQKELVLDLLTSEKLRMFGSLLSRGLPDDDDITHALRRAFEAERDPEQQLGLFHNLVARPLPPEEASSLAEWARQNADRLIAEQVAFFRGPDALQMLKHRISEDSYANKRWVYMYSAHALQAPAAIRSFLEPFADADDLLVSQAAAASLERIPN